MVFVGTEDGADGVIECLGSVMAEEIIIVQIEPLLRDVLVGAEGGLSPIVTDDGNELTCLAYNDVADAHN